MKLAGEATTILESTGYLLDWKHYWTKISFVQSGMNIFQFNGKFEHSASKVATGNA
jgi:hypothetical protein